MNVATIDAVSYGVTDLAEARRFWSDFGLSLQGEDRDRLLFGSLDGSHVEVRHRDDPALPPPIESGPGVREVIFGCRSPADVAAIAAEISRDREVREDGDGTIHALDPLGIGIGFRASRCKPVVAPDPGFNMPGRVGRRDRARFYAAAHPMEMTHLAFMVPRTEPELDFYVRRLGFKVSDSYRGTGYFLRGGASVNHHNLFLLDPGGKGERLGFHHLAFEMADIHEVFGGGLHMTRKGWPTMLGPGRHPVSSCYFWYFLNPCGGGAEYDFDSDIVGESWVPREFEQTPEAFAEWCLQSGMEESLLYRGVQTGDTISPKADRQSS
ncbi:MAG: VOC family protein [Gammaproteobacteria bacterium]|nr:VOC family protein [Gammaproteobacteria bacterium]